MSAAVLNQLSSFSTVTQQSKEYDGEVITEVIILGFPDSAIYFIYWS
jgi:hypothetical protein